MIDSVLIVGYFSWYSDLLNISSPIIRGAAGRLMRLEDTQMLLDDFGIPLQISSSSDSKEKNDVSLNSSILKIQFLLWIQLQLHVRVAHTCRWSVVMQQSLSLFLSQAPSSVPPTPPPMKFNSGCLLPQISKRKMSAPGYINSHMVSTVVKQESKEGNFFEKGTNIETKSTDFMTLS